MKFIRLALAMLALIAAPAHAQTISLHPGEMVIVRIDGWKSTVEWSGPADPISKYDIYMIWRTESVHVPPGVKIMPPAFVMQGEGPPDPPRPVPQRLQLTFRRVPALQPGSPDNSVLVIANGYGDIFTYHAALHVNGRSTVTDVCEVPPDLRGLEHWPYVVDEIEISDLALRPPTIEMRCQ